MADPFRLPKNLRDGGWKIKIYDNERLEPPHVTLICRERVWQIGLRDKSFLVPPGGRWRDIDTEVREILEEQWETLRDTWDEKRRTNPVSSEEDEGDGN